MAPRRKFGNRKPKGGRKGFVKRSQYKLKPNFRKASTVGAVKRVVKQVLARRVETKVQVYDWMMTPLCLQSTTGTLTNNYVVLNPSNATGNSYTVGRGTAANQMTGNSINTRRGILNYVLTLNNYNATTNTQMRPYYVRVYIYKYKKQPLNDPQVNNVCGAGIDANFFEQGDFDIGFSGQLDDLNNHMNRDAYIYLAHKTFKLGNAIPMVGATPGAPNYYESSNDFKMSAFGKWNVTKYLPKIVRRDDGAGVFMDPYVVCLFQVIAADGTLITNNQAPITAKVQMRYEYTDA